MQSLLRINYIEEPIATEIAAQFNFLLPGFCIGNGKHSFHENVYAFVLSQKPNWQDNQDDILNILTKFSSVLNYAQSFNASIELDIGIHTIDYIENDRDSIEFEFSDNFLQILSKHDIHFGISVFTMKLVQKYIDND
jgi:hypothetical protein